MMDFYQHELESPVGLVYVVSDGINLRGVDYEGNERRLQLLLERYYDRYRMHSATSSNDAVSRLQDYFAGNLHAVDDVAVATNGTEFQKLVWAALRTIPAGATSSYGAIARQIGRPAACRAVGLANGSNPINIFVPCHRVIGTNNKLTGYGGGLRRKEWLLNHEGASVTAKPKNLPRDLFTELTLAASSS